MAKNISRRDVIRSSVVGAAGAAIGAVAQPALGVRGANERIRVAQAGIHGQGHGHLKRYAQMDGVELVYLVDPDSRLFDSRAKDAREISKGRSDPNGIQDIRRALDDKSIDAISIATPNHWHSLMTVWACQAGKDVYVEKPMSHNITEGRRVVQAARKYKRIVQHGTQSRSDKNWARIAAVITSGKLGKLHVSRGLCYKPGSPQGPNTRSDIGFKPVKRPPEGFDWNLWQGPAKYINYHENLVHYRWHWFWATGNGDLGNQGVHEMDKARWMIPGAKLPKSCVAFGGRIGHYDQGTAASTHVAIMDYGETQLIFETRGLPKKGHYKGATIGNVMHLDAGTIVNQKFFPKGSDQEAPLPEVDVSHGPGNDHMENFILAVRSRDMKDLYAESIEGHYSSALCHLANMSIRLGNKIPFSPRTEAFGNNEYAYEALGRTVDYLADNGIDVQKSGYTLGRKLVVDAKTESIVDDAEANALLTRDYRKPFAMPKRV
jgi:predicted dehydrogenase